MCSEPLDDLELIDERVLDGIKKNWRGPFRVVEHRDMFGLSWKILGMSICGDGQWREHHFAETHNCLRNEALMIAKLIGKALITNENSP